MEIEHKLVIQSNTGTACTSIIKNFKKKNLSLVNICYCCRVDLWNILCLFTCVYACMHKKKNSKTHLQFFYYYYLFLGLYLFWMMLIKDFEVKISVIQIK